MIKRIIALCLLITITLSTLSACGSSDSENTEPATQPATANRDVQNDQRTLFIYMCGSNLETKQGLASKNIDELLAADTGDLNIVIQTGGAKIWRSHGISTTANQRYEVRDGELVLIETLDQLNMGDPATLTDFLAWGQEHYPTDRSMLVLWDHGAGAAKGLCFDENYSFDGLSLMELHDAIVDANLVKPFEIIGFDACLMGMYEVAALINDNAQYMVASEEIEPSGGWDYKALAEAYASDKEPLEVGKVICDSYMEKCKSKGKDLLATLSVFDLSYIGEMRGAFETTAALFYYGFNDPQFSSYVIDAANTCEKFGGDNAYQGAANMLDLISFIRKATEDISQNVVDVFFAVDHFVPYFVCSGHRKLGGVSFYYPMVYDRKEIQNYISLGICDEYNEYLTQFYLNTPKNTIEFTDKGHIDESGAFTMSLTPASIGYLSQINYVLMTTDGDGTRRILSTNDELDSDWDSMTFRSIFRGTRLALDGHPMFSSTVSNNEEFTTYSTPVIVNGENNSLRFALIKIIDLFHPNPYYRISGLWAGYDENGLPSSDIIPLKEGDRVQIVTDIMHKDDKTEIEFNEEFIIGEDGGVISEIPLDDGVYQYAFVVTDIFGNSFFSDLATFELSGGKATLTKVEAYQK